MTVEASSTQGAAVAHKAVAEGPGTTAREWRLRRNCSLAPRQVLRVYAALSTVCLGIGTLCWWHGATLVLPFAWLEVMVLGVALVVYARHAADSESLRLECGVLCVQRECAGRVERYEFRLDRVRIDPGHDDRSLIELSGQGSRVRIGRLVRPEVRRQLVHELRQEMRSVCRRPVQAVGLDQEQTT